jgi:hypothetical protein
VHGQLTHPWYIFTVQLRTWLKDGAENTFTNTAKYLPWTKIRQTEKPTVVHVHSQEHTYTRTDMRTNARTCTLGYTPHSGRHLGQMHRDGLVLPLCTMARPRVP